MIEPTIGRVVWVRNRHGRMHDQPETAQICFVHSNTLINVGGLDHVGQHFRCVNIQLRQGEPSEVIDPNAAYCEWMPYQKGQAAKTDAVMEEVKRMASAGEPLIDVRKAG